MLQISRNLAIVLGTAIVSIALIYLSIPRGNTGQNRFDVILVLGTPANSDGAISQIGRSLVLEAIRQYRSGVAPRLLMTGGAAHNQFVEAKVMAQFAQAQGVPASATFEEEQSRDTVQNAYYSFRIMQSHDWQSALVIGRPSHLRRASLIFRYYPIAWRMQAAPWPPGMPLLSRFRSWCSEAVKTCYARIFGFPESSQQYIPRVPFNPPHL
jgi:uncharacterized SAM-binding protein YcdF (DUF218 family)